MTPVVSDSPSTELPCPRGGSNLQRQVATDTGYEARILVLRHSRARLSMLSVHTQTLLLSEYAVLQCAHQRQHRWLGDREMSCPGRWQLSQRGPSTAKTAAPRRRSGAAHQRSCSRLTAPHAQCGTRHRQPLHGSGGRCWPRTSLKSWEAQWRGYLMLSDLWFLTPCCQEQMYRTGLPWQQASECKCLCVALFCMSLHNISVY